PNSAFGVPGFSRKMPADRTRLLTFSWRDRLKPGLQTSGKFFEAVEALFNIRQAGGIADAEIVVRAESNPWHRRDFLFVEKSGAKFARFEAEFRNVRKQIKRAFGVDATDSGNPIQPLVGVAAALGIFGQPALEMILRAGQCRHAAFLGKGSWIAGAVALNRINGLGDGFRRSQESKPPPGHRPRFRETMHHNPVFIMGLGEARDTHVLSAVI